MCHKLSADGTLTGYENLLFFASSAIYPIAIMPGWLQVVARVNPLSYQVDALRLLMVTGSGSMDGLAIDVAVPLVVTAALIAL
ncbi:MAG TPA: ABC transporter permease, partial [Ktedonobacterales bacterium]|nr:ABC transporter permease [Ktedonobacterales bacterium]